MIDWLTYAPADLVPFSAATYQRLFDRYNAAHPWAVGGGVLEAILFLRRMVERQNQ